MLHVLQMAQNPQTVPAKYGGFGGVNDDEATIFEPEATIFPTDPSHMFPPSDRSVPPVAVKPSLQTAPAVTPDPGQPVAQTFAPPLYPAPSESDVDGLKAPPRFDLGDERSHPNPLPDRPSPHGGAGKMWLLAIFIVAGLGGAAIFAIPFFGSSQPDEIGSAAPVATQHEPGIATPEPVLEGGSAIARLAAARTPIGSDRAGVLAAAPMDPCHYVARIESGFDRGRLAVFAPDPTVGIETTLGAFMAAFDERPATVPFSVTEEQCAVLEFARALQGRGARDPDLLQPVTVITLDDPVLDVRAEDLRGRPFWFVAIDPQGLVSRLDQFRVETTNAGNRYRIQFSGAPSERGDQYLLLALASDEALVSAATMSSGVHARAILDAVAQELLSQAVPAGVALSYVFFTHQPGSVAP
jgi:serine/threonine-protein kinase